MARISGRAARNGRAVQGLAKAPTGITGLDEITLGGLPRGRATLVCGSAGCGKTLLGLEFLLRGINEFNEPGVFMTFEETPRDLARNVVSLGFDIPSLVAQKKLAIDHVFIDRGEIDETGEYDLEGLFVRLDYAIKSVGAKRVVLDTIESLFSGLMNQSILRSEIRRLFGWLKERGLTTVITGERGDGEFTRQGLEEYVSDCVILLDHRVREQISTRRLRIVKYRGSTHGTNEYPFLIDAEGISVLPITSMSMDHKVSDKRVSTGIRRLDAMLGGKGLFAGSTTLVSGTAGTGKTSLCSHIADAMCRSGGKAMYLAFEESPEQIMRNMGSIGLDLRKWVKNGRLFLHSSRPTVFGLEMHLVVLHKMIVEFQPDLVVLDPITNLMDAGTPEDARAMVVRLVDYLKSNGITAVFTTLTSGVNSQLDATEVGISSLVDTWILLRMLESSGERNRAIYVLKSRGMAHSNQVREFQVTDDGIQLVDVYLGPEGVVTGSARVAQEVQARENEEARQAKAEAKRRLAERRRLAIRAQIASLHADLEAESSEIAHGQELEKRRRRGVSDVRAALALARKFDRDTGV